MRKKFHSVVFVFLFGLIIRIIHPTYGSPIFDVIYDESGNYLSALYMLWQKTIVVLHSQYPPLGVYIQIPFLVLSYMVLLLSGTVKSLNDFIFFLSTHEGYFLFIPRLLSGLLGAGTIITTFIIAQILFPKDKRVAFFSAVFLSLSFNHIQYSHQGRPWILSLFFLSVACIFMFRQNYRFFLSTLFIIITGGFLFQVGLIGLYIFTLIILSLLYGHKLNNQSLLRCTLYIISIAISFKFWLSLVQFQLSLPFLFKTSIDNFMPNVVGFFTRELFLTEPILLVLTVLFLLKPIAWQNPYRIISFFIVSYLLLSEVLFYHASRYLLPLLPFMSIFAGYVASRIRSKQYITILIVLTSVLPIFWLRTFLATPTYVQARNWLNGNILPSTTIASTSIRFNGYTASWEAINITQRFQPHAFQLAKANLKPNEYPDNVRYIIFLEMVTDIGSIDEMNKTIKDLGIQYVIDYYWDPHQSLHQKTGNTYHVLKHFSPLSTSQTEIPLFNIYESIGSTQLWSVLPSLKRAGPYVDILYESI